MNIEERDVIDNIALNIKKGLDLALKNSEGIEEKKNEIIDNVNNILEIFQTRGAIQEHTIDIQVETIEEKWKLIYPNIIKRFFAKITNLLFIKTNIFNTIDNKFKLRHLIFPFKREYYVNEWYDKMWYDWAVESQKINKEDTQYDSDYLYDISSPIDWDWFMNWKYNNPCTVEYEAEFFLPKNEDVICNIEFKLPKSIELINFKFIIK